MKRKQSKELLHEALVELYIKLLKKKGYVVMTIH